MCIQGTRNKNVLLLGPLFQCKLLYSFGALAHIIPSNNNSFHVKDTSRMKLLFKKKFPFSDHFINI